MAFDARLLVDNEAENGLEHLLAWSCENHVDNPHRCRVTYLRRDYMQQPVIANPNRLSSGFQLVLDRIIGSCGVQVVLEMIGWSTIKSQ